jgi:hypothetical protein
MKTKRMVMVLAALLVAAPAFAEWPTPVDPSGPNSGAGRAVAQAPAPSPTVPGDPIAGAGRTVAGGVPTPADPGGPNSGVGNHSFTGEPDSGAGRSLV